MTDGGMNTRELTLDILLEILEREGLSHVVLRQALSKYQYLDKQDRAFITRVTEGTLEYLIQIDHILNQYSRTKVNKMKPLIRTLLRMSVYQILYMNRIPDSAVCNEAVKLAAKRRFEGLKGFVNGVLRSISREKEHITFPDLSVQYAMPQWLIDMWLKTYDGETVRNMLEAFLKERPVSVRCNLDKADRESIITSLQSQGVTVKEHEFADDILYLEHIDYMEQLEAFRQGWITAQDYSSSCVAAAAGIKGGDVVLDVCGAPGGKALHAASLLLRQAGDGAGKLSGSAPGRLSDAGHVYVRDISFRKAAMIQENVDRCGYSHVTVSVQDACEPDETMIGQADVVLADLPCSGLGVIGRKPDIKLRIKPDDIDALARLQRQILSVVWQYVKPGGVLVYSTCTVTEQENMGNLGWFLEHYPFQPVNIEGRLGEGFRSETLSKGYVQFLPGRYPCDGFFLSVLKRV